VLFTLYRKTEGDEKLAGYPKKEKGFLYQKTLFLTLYLMPCTWLREYSPGDTWAVCSIQAALRHIGWIP